MTERHELANGVGIGLRGPEEDRGVERFPYEALFRYERVFVLIS